MKRFLLYIFIVNVYISNFAQVLLFDGESLILVNDSVEKKPISEMRFNDCKCTEYIPYNLYDYPGFTGKIFTPIKYRGEHMILKNTEEFWGSINGSGEHFFQFKHKKAPAFLNDDYYIINYEYVDDDEYWQNGMAIYDNHDSIVGIYKSLFSDFKSTFLVQDQSNFFGILGPDMLILLAFEYRPCSWDTKNFDFNIHGLLALKNKDGFCGMVNYEGDIILPFEYDFIEDPVQEQNMIEKDGKWGTIDQTGKIIVPMIYEKLEYNFYSRPLNLIKLNGLWIITDSLLNPVSENKFTDIVELTITERGKGYSSEEPATYNAVKEPTKKWGLMALGFDYVAQPIYDTIITEGDIYICSNAQQIDLIDQKGTLIHSYSNSEIQLYDDSGKIMKDKNYHWLFIKMDGGKKGIINQAGEEVIPCIYDSIVYDWKMFLVYSAGRYGWVDPQNKITVPQIYESACGAEIIFDESYNVIGYGAVMFLGKKAYWVNIKTNEIIDSKKVKDSTSPCLIFEAK